ncbi:MAG: GIY-YIG nuclease family protein [Candidatus Komeilibacteria bacterium]
MNSIVYVLKLADHTTYIGYTNNLVKRLESHNAGKTRSIKHKLPAKLVYYETFSNKTLARKRELELKKNSSKKENLYKRIFTR